MSIVQLEYVSEEEKCKVVHEDPITIEDELFIQTGLHQGRIRNICTFHSKDKKSKYAKITVGVPLNLNDGQSVIVELDRVFLADYRNGSHLVRQLEELNAIQDKKFYPDKLFNQAVEIEVVLDENASADSRFKHRISSIKSIEALPDNLDFEYVAVNRIGGYDIVPTNNNVKPSENSASKSKLGKIDFNSIDEDDDFLTDDDFSED